MTVLMRPEIDEMVGLEILIRIRPDKRIEFLQAFELLTRLELHGGTRVDLNIFEQIGDPNTFLWLEHWDSLESLNRYLQENRFKAMMGAIDVMGQLLQKRTFTIRKEN
jgi:quinol monooxygenase YgiN